MLRLGQKVYIVADSFEQQLPIGEYGYIIAYERNPDNAFDYVLRVPKLKKHVCVPSADIQLESVLLRQAAERVEKEALIDYALATKDEQLFHRIMNGDSLEQSAEDKKEKLNQDEFIKQVNLKAWI